MPNERSLKQTLITAGLVCSILTAVVGAGKEISDVAQDWSSSGKAEITQLHADIDALSKKIEERDMKQQRANLALRQQIFDLKMATAYSALSSISTPKSVSSPTPLMTIEVPPPVETTEVASPIPTASAKSDASAIKPSMKFGWIMGIIGLACGALFGILHLMHKKGPTANA